IRRIGSSFARAVDATTSFVSKGVVSELEQELAIAVRSVLRLNDGLPRCWTTIEASTQRLATLVMFPNRTLRLRDESGIKAGLLVRRRSKVIVRKDCAERAILTSQIQRRIGKPSLHGRLCAEGAEERMWLRG